MSERIENGVTAMVEQIIKSSGGDCENLFRKVADATEKPLLNAVMTATKGNQSKAAIMLGINRATLRTKLKRHGMM